MNLALLLQSSLIVVVSLLGGLLPLATVLSHTRLQSYLSFSAGSMLGAVFFHMLPEAVRLGSAETITWSAAGLLSLFFLERFFSFHHHESPAHSVPDHAASLTPAADEDAPPRDPQALFHGHARESLPWGAAAFGLAVHSLVGGVALASAVGADFAVNRWLGATSWGVFFATLIHKPADALTIISLMLRARAPRWLAHAVNLGFALMIPLGVILFRLGLAQLSPPAASNWTAIALSFSSGTFLCIALSDLLPELHFHQHDRVQLSLSLLAGVGLMAGSLAVELV
jgi:zinc and cadmium transporter